MNEIAIAQASRQLEEMKTAIAAGNYSSLQDLLLTQAVLLHNVGLGFIQKAAAEDKFSFKAACIDLGLRSLSQSQKTMVALRTLRG